MALTGCASWFESEPEVTEQPSSPPSVALISQAYTASTEQMVQRAVELAVQSSNIETRKDDAVADRQIKKDGTLEVVRVSAWAMGVGFIVFLAGGVIPGGRAAGGWTIALGAAIATLAPWLNDILGDDQVRIAGYAAFSILAGAVALGGSWWFLDMVRDAVRRK